MIPRWLWFGAGCVMLLGLAGVAVGPELALLLVVDDQAPIIAAGEKAFLRLGCDTCHGGQPGARGPTFDGLYGSEVTLRGGGKRRVDEAYLRESIWTPGAAVVAGYELIMPVYKGQVGELEMQRLIAYIRSRATDGL